MPRMTVVYMFFFFFLRLIDVEICNILIWFYYVNFSSFLARFS